MSDVCVNCDRPLQEKEGECSAGCDQDRRRNDGSDIYEDFISAIQNAEEMGGPEGMDYVRLMDRVAAEATRRAAVVREKLADLEVSTCLDCGAPHPHVCPRSLEES